ncbi:hypothetical protein SanaruYs_26670 [Chryseotalea sanaruensis]|uniref:Uncharacterized protein n=1 Tax=Chryseotalea sanaruensis TaxID=2482724 RepID=A0A401UC25_9BACT|nr:hypothetical protein [Chryseotalea sanaruensis]GCC52430.1 hypothetical protein SanaruYs_26670 [Chryseotalea sanaruensis]
METSSQNAQFHSELIHSLIKEELKSRKVFNTLRNLGLDGCPYQPHVDELIIKLLGFDMESDQAYDFCYQLFENHAENIIDDTSLTEQTKLIYLKLSQATKNH